MHGLPRVAIGAGIVSRIFLSYRRDDTAGYAGRLYDRLLAKFGSESVFRDIDSIEPGVDFVGAIDQAVRGCDAFVAVIGNSWLTATDRSGKRRLDDPDDHLRNEIAAALRANLLVIPVLVERAPMPAASDLPPPLARLTRHNAIELSDDRWNYDIERLIARLEAALSGRDQSRLQVPGLEAPSVIRSSSRWSFYRARRTGTSRSVTVKVLRVSDIPDEARERFEQDCQAVASLSWHPGLATVHECGITDDGYPYTVMEDLDGSSLEDRLRRTGRLPWQEATTIGARVAAALDAAHQAGLLHSDVNPSNVLVGPVGEPLLSDFGMARLEHEVEAITSGVINSVAHAAPEALTSATYSVSSDVYSLGSTLHALLSGAAPFVGDDAAGFVAMVARATTRPVPDLRPLGVPDPVCSVIERAMAKTPELRWASAAALGQALRNAQQLAISGEAISGEPAIDRALGDNAVPAHLIAPLAPEVPRVLETTDPGKHSEPDPVPETTRSPVTEAPSPPLAPAPALATTNEAPPGDEADEAEQEPAAAPLMELAASPAWWRERSRVGWVAAVTVVCMGLGALAIALSSSGSEEASPSTTPSTASTSPPTTSGPPEEFLDDLSKPSSWGTPDVVEGSATFADGGYRVTLKRPGRFLDFGAPARLGPRTSVEVDASAPTGDGVLYGLFCKASANSFPRYAAYIRPDGFWTIRRYGHDGSLRVLAQADEPSRYSPAIHSSGPNRIRLDCLGDARPMRLALFVNGEPVADVEDPDPVTTSDIGVTVAEASAPPIDVTFTNFRARKV